MLFSKHFYTCVKIPAIIYNNYNNLIILVIFIIVVIIIICDYKNIFN